MSSVTSPARLAALQEVASTDIRKGRWGSLMAMAFSFMVDNSESGLINILFPAIRAALGLNLGALGLLTSISRLARMLFGPLWAMLADRYGRKRILFIVTGGWGIWTVAAGLSQNFTQLLILYSIGVIGTVASEPIAKGLLADLFEEEERSKAYGAIRTVAVSAGLIITPLLGQFANIENGWRYGLFVMGDMSIFSGILILLFVKEPKRRTAVSDDPDVGMSKLSDAARLFKNRTILLLAGNLLFITSLVLFSFLVTYYADVRGWDNAAAILYTTFFAGFALSSFLGDRFDKRYGPKGRIMLMQLYLVAFAVMSFVALQIDWGQSFALSVVLFVFGLIGSLGFSGAVLPIVSAVVPPELSATAFALLFSLVQGLISGLLSLALGYLAQAFGLPTVMFWMVTVPYAVNVLYWFLFYPVYPKDVAAQQARRAGRASARVPA